MKMKGFFGWLRDFLPTRGGGLQEGRAPPSNPQYYLNWAQDNAKTSIANLNAALGKLLSLSTALLGGTIAFWTFLAMGEKWKIAGVALSAFTVLVCLFSVMPKMGRVDPTNATDIRAYMEQIFAYKRRPLNFAAGALVMTLLVMVAGLIIHAARPDGAAMASADQAALAVGSAMTAGCRQGEKLPGH